MTIADGAKGGQPVLRRRSLLFVLGPAALAALAFEDSDRRAFSGVHDLADQSWLSTAPTPESVADF